MTFRAVAFAIAASLLSSPAVAAPRDDTITVTAQGRKELQQRITKFVRSATIVPEAGQYARRNRGYCPTIINLEALYVPRVIGKVQAAGRIAGLPDTKAGCVPDLAIIFTDDGDAMVRAIYKRRARLFTGTHGGKKRELFDSGRAVRWWYATGKSGADGGTIGTSVTASVPGEGGASGGIPGFQGVDTFNVYNSSLIQTNIKVNLETTYVIVDTTKANGLPLDAVAAFAAMVSFAQINGAQDFAGFPSILSLFAGDRDAATPRDFTDWDRAYLRALYRTPANRVASLQRTKLAGEMLKAIAP